MSVLILHRASIIPGTRYNLTRNVQRLDGFEQVRNIGVYIVTNANLSPNPTVKGKMRSALKRGTSA